MPEKISVSVQLLNAILGYMGKQPYEQVAPLIQAIQDEAKGQVPEPEVEEVAEAA
jgi:hypothetical protein